MLLMSEAPLHTSSCVVALEPYVEVFGYSWCRANLEHTRQSRPDSGLRLSYVSGKRPDTLFSFPLIARQRLVLYLPGSLADKVLAVFRGHAPSTLNPHLWTLNLEPYALNSNPNPQPPTRTLNPQPPKPQTPNPNPKPQTPNPKHHTLQSEPSHYSKT